MTIRTRSMSIGLAVAVAAVTPAQEGGSRTIDVRVDPRTELMSIVFRLAGNPEYGQGKIDDYTAAVDAHFERFREDAVVRRARDLRRSRGVSYDAPMSLAVHLEPGTTWKLAVPLDPWPENLDTRWTERDVKAFLRDARRFAERSRFEEFLAEHSELYASSCARVRAVLDQHTDMSWFDAFFGERPKATFSLCVGLLNGGGNYGPRARLADGTEELFSVLGAWKTDEAGLPAFDESFVSTIVHEFCHSYCNHLIEAHLDELRDAGEMIWPHVADGMKAQAYGNWETVLKESLVRACVVRYLFATRGERGRKMEIEVQRRREFLWIEELSDLLAEYEGARDTNPELASFMPRVVEFFRAYAPTLEQQLAATPRVVSIVPANGQQDVDPSTTAIVVTFDRPMLDRAWAVVGGGPNFPETTGKPSYDDSRTVLTIPVRLKPSWRYELWLNRGRFDSFQSAERVKLRPVHVTFQTRR